MLVRRVIGLFSLSLMAVLSAGLLAQQGGQAGGGAGASAPAPATPTTPTTPTSPTPSPGRPTPGERTPTYPGQQQQQQSPFPEMPRPIFLSGKVTLQDGTPPPDSAVIERVCNGIVRPEAYTDSKGRFSFQLGQNNNAMMADASVGGDSGFGSFGNRNTGMTGMGSNAGISERDLWGCEIRASLAGYQSEAIPLTGRRSLDNPELGTIVLRRFGNVEGTTVSMTSLQAPKDAKKAFDKGREAIRKEKWTEAKKQLEKAVGLYPKYSAAWNELGIALLKSDDRAGARVAFEKALESDAKFVSPYLQLAALSAQESKWEEVVGTTSRVFRLDPFNYPNMYFFDAVARFNLRDLDQAEKSAREGIKLDPQNHIPALNHVLGVIMANKGEYGEAATLMKTYLKLAPNARDAAQVKKQLAEVEKVAQSQSPSAP